MLEMNKNELVINFLKELSLKSSTKKIKKIYQTVYSDVLNGEALSNSLKKHSYFDDFSISIIKMGENADNVLKSLQSIVEYNKERNQISNKILKYPSLISLIPVFAITVLFFLTTVIL